MLAAAVPRRPCRAAVQQAREAPLPRVRLLQLQLRLLVMVVMVRGVEVDLVAAGVPGGLERVQRCQAQHRAAGPSRLHEAARKAQRRQPLGLIGVSL